MEDQMGRKGVSSVTVVLITILVALVFGGGAYYYLNNKAEKEKKDLNSQITDLQKEIATLKAASTAATTTPTATADETAGWKTYTNTTYGFSFKYPADYNLTDASTFSANDGVFVDSSSTGGFEQPHLISVEAEKTSLTLDAYLAKSIKEIV